MLPSGAANAACLVLVALPTSYATQPQQFASWVAGCAFCGGHAIPAGPNSLRRRTQGSSRGRGGTTTGSSNSHPASCSSLPLFGSKYSISSSNVCRGKPGLLVAAARRWEEEEDSDGVVGAAGAAPPLRRRQQGRRGRKPLRAPWEDLQWENPARKGAGIEEGEDWEEKEEEEDEVVQGLRRGRRRGRVQRRDYLDYEDDDDDEEEDNDDYDDLSNYRPRRRRRAKAGGLEAEPLPSGWDTAGWFGDSKQANQGGIFDWARSFYNTLFWYGGASSGGDDELPAMNFQDLLERYDVPASERTSARPRPIVPPEALAAEQDFRWRPSGRDSAAAAERKSRRRRKPRKPVAYGGVPAVDVTKQRPGRRQREPEREWEEGELEWRAAGRRAMESGRRGIRSREDAVAIGQLRRKQTQLAARELKYEMDLEKVRERLNVVDATVELWMRRSAGMLARGASETDTDVLQAKRRIYGLKEEGRQLDNATVDLEGRLEDCRAKLDRIVQELELLGEDPVPQAFYAPDDDESGQRAETAEAGIERRGVDADGSPGLEMDRLGLEPEKKRGVDAVPAAVADAEI